MQVSLEWLSEFVDLPPLDVLVDKLARVGIEVEAVSDPGKAIEGVLVGEVRSVSAHPKAERLTVCDVTTGASTFQVVCGAPNVAAGQRVAFAPVGARLPALTIDKRRIRGVESEGMLCSKQDLGLEAQSAGIWVLPPEYRIGESVVSEARLGPVLTLSITPNRPDLLSHLGVAREVAAASGKRLKSAAWRVTEKGPGAESLARVIVEAPAACRRYVARVVQNVKVGPSPVWLRERLERVGQRSINNVVDATNYVLIELGQPLHAFDLKKLAVEAGLPTVRVRSARQGERLTTLDGAERALDPSDLVIADAERPVAIAGIMGGRDTEVSAETTSVFIESAWFDPVLIRRTSRRYGLSTEASYRFERGVDPGLTARAADHCAQILAEVAGGHVAKGLVEVTQKGEGAREVRVRLPRVGHLLGIELAAETVVQLLEPLEIRCTGRNDSSLSFQVPSFRADLSREVDLIEEIARRYGYDQVTPRLPDTSTEFRYEPLPQDARETARRSLLVSGCSEAVTFGMGNPEHFVLVAAEEGEPLRLANPLGEELSALRTTLLPGLLQAVAHNLRQGAKHIRLFEVGNTFHPRQAAPDEDEGNRLLPREDVRVGCVLYGGRYQGRWHEHSEQVDFSDLATVAENLIEAFDPAEPLVRVGIDRPGWHPLGTALLRLGSTEIGVMGQVHPSRARAFDIEGPLYALEVSLTALGAAPRRSIRYHPLPKFPGTRRDLAVIADASLEAERIRAFLLQRAGGNLGPQVIERVSLFDVYAGKPIPRGKVSLAFAIEYRSSERTLTDAEVNAAFAAVAERLAKELDVEPRTLGGACGG